MGEGREVRRVLFLLMCEKPKGGLQEDLFFSSRRRHTRSLCDWSSDVCSSDLIRDVALGTSVLHHGCPQCGSLGAPPFKGLDYHETLSVVYTNILEPSISWISG